MPFLRNEESIRYVYIGQDNSPETIAGDTENRFTYAWLEEMEKIIGSIEEETRTGSSLGVVFYAEGKFFSNGLDVETLLNPQEQLPYLERVSKLLARVLTLGAPTAVAINGHAFGAAAIFALCADHRVMRTERGYYSLPEVAMKVPFPRGMATIIRQTLSPHTAREAMLTARRYGSEAAVQAGIVHCQEPVDNILSQAASSIEPYVGYAGRNYANVKAELYHEAIEDLHTPIPPLTYGD